MKNLSIGLASVLAILGTVSALPYNGTAIARRQCKPATPPTPPPTEPAPPAEPAPAPEPAPEPEPAPAPEEPAPPPPSGGGSSGDLHYTVYMDKWQSPFPTADKFAGWTDVYLSFWLSNGAADMALGFVQLEQAEKDSVLKSFTDNNMRLMVSAFGATEEPTTAGFDPVTTANNLAQFVKDNGLHGVDVDYEDLTSFNMGTGAEDWLIAFTKALRAQLPAPYIITHAPLAPWFQPGDRWAGGGYLKVNKEVGDLVDWYNMQFYNQGVTEYTDCAGLMEKSSDAWPGTSVGEMIANGVDPKKIVIGKPAATGDAANGFFDPAALGKCAKEHADKHAGIMSWQYPTANTEWINTVKNA